MGRIGIECVLPPVACVVFLLDMASHEYTYTQCSAHIHTDRDRQAGSQVGLHTSCMHTYTKYINHFKACWNLAGAPQLQRLRCRGCPCLSRAGVRQAVRRSFCLEEPTSCGQPKGIRPERMINKKLDIFGCDSKVRRMFTRPTVSFDIGFVEQPFSKSHSVSRRSPRQVCDMRV